LGQYKTPPEKKRRSSSEIFGLLKERASNERTSREKELEDKREEREALKEERNILIEHMKASQTQW
jgi:hypothetical protein